MEMTEEGTLQRIANPSSHSAAPFLRLSPREIVLDPGVSQRIKILANFPPGMAEGEYRSHLSFEPISTPKAPTPGAGEGLKLKFDIRSVVTIPVILRNGRMGASASISDGQVHRDEAGWYARARLHRTGNRSIRGDVNVSFVPADGKPKIDLGLISSLPVYFPNSSRIITVRLSRDPMTLGKGEIEIRFTEPERSRSAAMAQMLVSLTG
jgi:hypothetical protein